MRKNSNNLLSCLSLLNCHKDEKCREKILQEENDDLADRCHHFDDFFSVLGSHSVVSQGVNQGAVVARIIVVLQAHEDGESEYDADCAHQETQNHQLEPSISGPKHL